MAVPKTHRVHCIQTSGADEVKVADTSNDIEKRFRVCRIRTPKTNSTTEQDSPLEDNIQPQLAPLMNLTTGLWVIVKYEDEKFPGEVTCIEDTDVEVNVMHRSALKPGDTIFYSRSQFL